MNNDNYSISSDKQISTSLALTPSAVVVLSHHAAKIRAKNLWSKVEAGSLDAGVEERADAGGFQFAEDLAIFIDAGLLEFEDVGHDDGVAFHAADFGHGGDLTGTIFETRLLDDQVDGGGGLFADDLEGQVHAGHQHHGLQTGESIARGVGVQGGQRPVMTGVHGLEHVERFAAAHLTDDDAVGAHTQRVPHQVANGNAAMPIDVGGLGLHADDVILLQFEFGCVLDGDDAFVVGDVAGKDIEEGGFSRAGAAGNDDVEARE